MNQDRERSRVRSLILPSMGCSGDGTRGRVWEDPNDRRKNQQRGIGMPVEAQVSSHTVDAFTTDRIHWSSRHRHSPGCSFRTLGRAKGKANISCLSSHRQIGLALPRSTPTNTTTSSSWLRRRAPSGALVPGGGTWWPDLLATPSIGKESPRPQLPQRTGTNRFGIGMNHPSWDSFDDACSACGRDRSGSRRPPSFSGDTQLIRNPNRKNPDRWMPKGQPGEHPVPDPNNQLPTTPTIRFGFTIATSDGPTWPTWTAMPRQCTSSISSNIPKGIPSHSGTSGDPTQKRPGARPCRRFHFTHLKDGLKPALQTTVRSPLPSFSGMDSTVPVLHLPHAFPVPPPLPCHGFSSACFRSRDGSGRTSRSSVATTMADALCVVSAEGKIEWEHACKTPGLLAASRTATSSSASSAGRWR